jgi:hypothetical protein
MAADFTAHIGSVSSTFPTDTVSWVHRVGSAGESAAVCSAAAVCSVAVVRPAAVAAVGNRHLSSCSRLGS